MTDMIMATICLVSLLVTLSLALLVALNSRRGIMGGSNSLVLMLLSISAWTFFYMIKNMTPDIQTKLVVTKLEYIGIATTTIAFVLLGKHSFLKMSIEERDILFGIVFCAVVMMTVWLNPGNLYYSSYDAVPTSGGSVALVMHYGLAFYLVQAAVFLCVMGTLVAITIHMIRTRTAWMQIALIVISVLIPFVTTWMHIAKITIYDYTNSAFSLTGIILYICFIKFGIYDSATYVKRHMVDMMDEAVFVLFNNGTVEYLNAQATKLLDKRYVDCVNKDMKELMPGFTGLEDGENSFRRRITFGEEKPVELQFRVSTLSDKKNKVIRYVITVQNVTDMADMEKQLHYLKEYDELTGFYRASKLAGVMEQYRSAHAEGLDGTILCAISVANRDKLLVVLSKEEKKAFDLEVSRYIKSMLPENAIVARYADNEYYVFSNHRPGLLAQIKRYIEQSVRAQVLVGQQRLMIELKVGVYVLEEGINADAAMTNVAFALNSALRSRTENVMMYDKYKKLQHELHRSLLGITSEPNYEQDFYVEFQPILDMESKRVIGAEAMTRWRHPTFGKIYPNVFIPVFESTGYMSRLGYTILEKTFCALKTWQDGLDDSFFLCVDISKQQIYQEGFLDKVEALIAKTGVRRSAIVLEIKESFAWEDLKSMATFSKAVRDMGMRMSIDGFMRGNASFVHIVDLKCDMIKIDPSFVKQIVLNEDQLLSMRVLSDICARLNVTMVAEQVEKLNELNAFKQCGIQYAQGYIFSRSVSKRDFLEYYQASRALA